MGEKDCIEKEGGIQKESGVKKEGSNQEKDSHEEEEFLQKEEFVQEKGCLEKEDSLKEEGCIQKENGFQEEERRKVNHKERLHRDLNDFHSILYFLFVHYQFNFIILFNILCITMK